MPTAVLIADDEEAHRARLLLALRAAWPEVDAVHECATRLVLADGELLLRTPLKELLSQLDPNLFWQIHRSVIVNHRHIAGDARVDEDNLVLTLRGRPERLPVSRHFQSLFRGQ